MNRETYLKELALKLKKLPRIEVESALDYYREYFEEAGEENTDQVIRKLGTPAQVSTHILADYAAKELDEYPNSTKKSISAIWFILLAILASPIALPILIFVFGIVFSFVMICAAFIFTFFTLIIALTFSGIFSIGVGFSVIAQHWQTSLLFIGVGLTASGIGILLFSPFVFVVKSASNTLAQWLKKIFNKMTRKRKEEL
ncbi:DUF1700 domain-containing protein [Bacillus sp. Bva_UNVM-123]|uniref:DUF1700 domain-containing protein n=1 Tax=Bacillus sp. Bva_UNVM-123 TaxID=2829798 RepID=UPI00391FABA9